jgi:hypothetical protein
MRRRVGKTPCILIKRHVFLIMVYIQPEREGYARSVFNASTAVRGDA